MHLVKRGAQIERKDIYGNTPLAIGLYNSHFNYVVILIEKGAAVSEMVNCENFEDLKEKWK